jgi:hypothetical protein
MVTRVQKWGNSLAVYLDSLSRRYRGQPDRLLLTGRQQGDERPVVLVSAPAPSARRCPP